MSGTGLIDKVVLVTGGAAGIGRATVAAFARERARVVCWDLQAEAGEAMAESFRGLGLDVAFDAVNVAEERDVAAAVESLLADHGRIDVLINNAGIAKDAQLVKWQNGAAVATMGTAEFDAVVAVNLRGVFLPTRAVVPAMIGQGGGAILSATSVVAHYGNFGQTNYVATKAGVIGMTQTWARELGRYGIRVNAVAPGFIATEMVQAMPGKVVEGMTGRTPLGRLGRPEEVAAVYLWLASDDASFVHGAVISVDGGLVVGT